MIEVKNVSMNFGDIQALNDISLTIQSRSIFGLIGTNGAGKSTLMRIISGIIKAAEGSLSVDDIEVFEHKAAKNKLFYISDDQYYFSQTTPFEMMQYYEAVYDTFDKDKFNELMIRFNLDPKRKIQTFSKGMKKQLSLILGFSANVDYLLCDETFDGLDPVMRQAAKGVMASEMEERGLTVVIASHNLREIEDICDTVGLLHKGGVLLSKEVESMKTNIHKIQCAFRKDYDPEALFSGFDIMKRERRGTLHTITLRGNKESIMEQFMITEPLFCEILPLTLEEIFISETEVVGYDIKKFIC